VYQEVKKEFPNISFDTVNRTLLVLLGKGLVKMVESGYGPRRLYVPNALLSKRKIFEK